MAKHKGTYSRGYLPHRDYAGSVQGITFRLGDSVPARTIAEWRTKLAAQVSRNKMTPGGERQLRKEFGGASRNTKMRDMDHAGWEISVRRKWFRL